MPKQYQINCAVPNCTNYRGGVYSLFKLPETPESLRDNWIIFLNKVGIHLEGKRHGFSHIFICQQHFAESDIMKSEKRSVLKKNSVPIFINPPENLQCNEKSSQHNVNDGANKYITVTVNILYILKYILFYR